VFSGSYDHLGIYHDNDTTGTSQPSPSFSSILPIVIAFCPVAELAALPFFVTVRAAVRPRAR
jgi:hypothetical protein